MIGVNDHASQFGVNRNFFCEQMGGNNFPDNLCYLLNDPINALQIIRLIYNSISQICDSILLNQYIMRSDQNSIKN